MPGWSDVTREHVIQAIRRYKDSPGSAAPSRNTFLIHEGREYPAKTIRAIAYQVCHGEKINHEAFNGGKNTARFFERLGFRVRYSGPTPQPQPVPDVNRQPKPGLGRVRQKNALQALLQKHFGIVVSEKSFEWLRVPREAEFDDTYTHIQEALRAYRGNQSFSQPGRPLSADFYVESLNLVIEYDEDQHFSQARRICLECYPPGLCTGFSVADWMGACTEINASDSHPANRDETRAFYDAVRDIEAAKQGVHLLRIRHGAIDWEAADAETALMRLLEPYSPGSPKPTPKKATDDWGKVNWRELEIDVQRVRLNYLKWLFNFTPPQSALPPFFGAGDDFRLLESQNGSSFTASPCGLGSVYAGGGKGQLRLPAICFAHPSDLDHETQHLKNSLSRHTRNARKQVISALDSGDFVQAWRVLMDYWWIKLGLHEYAHDVTYQAGRQDERLQVRSIRDYLVATMAEGVTVDASNTPPFSREDLLHFLRHSMRWNRYACCSFECGPIAVGRSGFVPYAEVAAARRDFFTGRDIVHASEAEKRALAKSSLEERYQFLMLYYEKPLSEMRFYAGFRKRRDDLRAAINDTQNVLNRTIEQEGLDLPAFTYVPG